MADPRREGRPRAVRSRCSLSSRSIRLSVTLVPVTTPPPRPPARRARSALCVAARCTLPLVVRRSCRSGTSTTSSTYSPNRSLDAPADRVGQRVAPAPCRSARRRSPTRSGLPGPLMPKATTRPRRTPAGRRRPLQILRMILPAVDDDDVLARPQTNNSPSDM